MDDWCQTHLGMPLERAVETAAREVAASAEELAPRARNFSGQWELQTVIDSDTAKTLILRLLSTHCSTCMGKAQFALCLDVLVMWHAAWMLHQYVMRCQRGTVSLGALRAFAPVAVYIASGFDGVSVRPKDLGITRDRIGKGLSELPSPFGFPLRCQLLDRISVHHIKAFLHMWLCGQGGRCGHDVGRVLARNIQTIHNGCVPNGADLRFLWDCVSR